MYSIELGAVLAPAISAVGVLILYHYIGREYLGADENIYWNQFRRVFLGGLDGIVKQKTPFTLTNRARTGEFVGVVSMTSQGVAVALEDAGYVQGVLAGLKYRGDRGDQIFEDGSMVFRESKSDLIPDVLAVYQTHVFWFDNGDGTVDLYAHYEYSSTNPLVAWLHYQAVGQNFERGVQKVGADLLSVGIDVDSEYHKDENAGYA